MTNMTSLRLAEAFLERARTRLDALHALKAEAEPSDVIRETRDIVGLCYRSMLRVMGIEVPRWRDVGEVVREHIDRFPADIRVHKERILGLYDSLDDARAIAHDDPASAGVDSERATKEAEWAVEIARINMDLVASRRIPATTVP